MGTPTPMLLATVGLLLIGEVAGSSSCEDCKLGVDPDPLGEAGQHRYLKCETCHGTGKGIGWDLSVLGKGWFPGACKECLDKAGNATGFKMTTGNFGYVLCENPDCVDDRRRMLQRQRRDSPVMQELLDQTGHPDRRRLPLRK